MRIERDQLIAGLPAREVRRFMRGAADQIIRIAVVTHFLGLSPAGARKFLKELERDGWIAAKVDHWEATEKGRALAMATAAKPLRRETAERLPSQGSLSATVGIQFARVGRQVPRRMVPPDHAIPHRTHEEDRPFATQASRTHLRDDFRLNAGGECEGRGRVPKVIR